MELPHLAVIQATTRVALAVTVVVVVRVVEQVAVAVATAVVAVLVVHLIGAQVVVVAHLRQQLRHRSPQLVDIKVLALAL